MRRNFGFLPVALRLRILTQGNRTIVAANGNNQPVFFRGERHAADVGCDLLAVEALPLLSLDLSPETHHSVEAGCGENSEGRMRPGEAADCAIVPVVESEKVYLRCAKTALVID